MSAINQEVAKFSPWLIISNPSSIHHMQYAPTYKLQLQLLSLWSWLLHKSGNSAGVVPRDCSLQWLQCAARADKEPRCCRHMQPGAACSSLAWACRSVFSTSDSCCTPPIQPALFGIAHTIKPSFVSSVAIDDWSIFRDLVALFRRFLRHPLDKIWRLHYVLPSCSSRLSCSTLLVTNTRL